MTILKEDEPKRSYGLRGGKRIYEGYNDERKVKGRKKKEEARGKHYYAKEFSKTNNELPKKNRDKIVCADSEKYLSGLPDNCVDLIFTSPPYNFGLDYDAKGDDAAMWKEYFDKLDRVWEQCIRVLKYGGRLVVNIQPLYSDYVPAHHFISNSLVSRGLIWKGEVMWEKNNYNCKYTAWGSWKSPSNPYMKYSWEFVEIFCKGSLKLEGSKENADIAADDFKKWVYGKWSIAPERKMKEYGHPAMFPEELAKRVIQLFSFRGNVVLDPFVGVGTACVVANRLGRTYLGVDVSKQYCDTAKKRLGKESSRLL